MLPVDTLKDDLFRLADSGCKRFVISAPTGSGKSTRLPVMLAEKLGGRILVLQPRRVAARMLAKGVASLYGENTGWHVRFDRHYDDSTKIVFLTEGILARMILEDPSLRGVSAIVFDEFHERNIYADISLALALRSQETLRKDIVIADLSAIHCSIDTLMHDETFYDAMSLESDWMYLEHYILSSLLYPDRTYPDFSAITEDCAGEALLFSNAYVTRTYRRRKIFTNMESMTRSFALRKTRGLSRLASIFALDPDVACYGPDTVKEAYIYNYEKDEPVRQLNAKIAEHIGYQPLKLEETEHHEGDDGTKLWFAVHIEKSMML